MPRWKKKAKELGVLFFKKTDKTCGLVRCYAVSVAAKSEFYKGICSEVLSKSKLCIGYHRLRARAHPACENSRHMGFNGGFTDIQIVGNLFIQ